MILVVASSKRELQGDALKPFRTVSLGVGKVLAGVGAYEAIVRYRPSHVVGIGICGGVSQHLSVGDLVIPAKVVQYDMDLRAFRLPRANTYGAEGERIGDLNTDMLSSWPAQRVTRFRGRAVHEGVTLGTADHFVTTEDMDAKPWIHHALHIDAVDMESYAIVTAARRASVPVTIIRAVSDTIRGERVSSLLRFLRDVSEDIGEMIACYSDPSEKSPTIL